MDSVDGDHQKQLQLVIHKNDGKEELSYTITDEELEFNVRKNSRADQNFKKIKTLHK